MSFEKYRVHEVAKDFGKQTKDITQILTTYATTPKNHMQVLDDKELSIIFEYLTQHNQVSGIQAIYADAAKPAEKKAEPARQQPAARKAEAEKKAAISELQGSVADLSISVASRVIGNDLNDDEHRKIVERYVNEAGSFNAN